MKGGCPLKGNKLDPGRVRVLLDLDRDLVRRIDHIAVDWDAFRKQAIERLLLRVVGEEEKEKGGVRGA
jgi:predicted transcriptional regulator